jgi:pimeloyl-ACP methyl ester carboxylesterase
MDRRSLWKSIAASTVVGAFPNESAGTSTRATSPRSEGEAPANHFIRTRDGTNLFYRDWGAGRPLLFVAPWALNSDCFTRTDFRADLRKVDVPVDLIHGDRDVSTPIDFTSRRTAPLLSRCELHVYENAAHGLPITHMDRLNADLLAFAKS